MSTWVLIILMFNKAVAVPGYRTAETCATAKSQVTSNFADHAYCIEVK